MNKLKSILVSMVLMIAALGSSLSAASATQWNVDKSHTQVMFSVNHFFTPVDGKFKDFDVTLHFDPNNLNESSIDVTIKVNSIYTGNDRRDGHLQSADFFDAEKYPLITFKSSEIMSNGDNNYVAKGTLTIKDVAKEIELPFTLLGVKELPAELQKNFGGIKKVASFSSDYKLNRNDYGVGTGNWAATVVIGDDVRLNVDLESNIK